MRAQAFCSGGDQRIRGDDGYVGDDGIGRLNVLDLQVQIRRVPEAGRRDGRGLRDRRRPRPARRLRPHHRRRQRALRPDRPRVGSFDGGYGSGLLARSVGQKKAREIWFLCRQYDAQEALDMGLVNTVVPLAELEEETVQWCRRCSSTARSRCA